MLGGQRAVLWHSYHHLCSRNPECGTRESPRHHKPPKEPTRHIAKPVRSKSLSFSLSSRSLSLLSATGGHTAHRERQETSKTRDPQSMISLGIGGAAAIQTARRRTKWARFVRSHRSPLARARAQPTAHRGTYTRYRLHAKNKAQGTGDGQVGNKQSGHAFALCFLRLGGTETCPRRSNRQACNDRRREGHPHISGDRRTSVTHAVGGEGRRGPKRNGNRMWRGKRSQWAPVHTHTHTHRNRPPPPPHWHSRGRSEGAV